MAERARYGSRPQITVDGAPLSNEVLPALVRTIVDTHLHMPDMFVLVFHDTQREVAARARLRFGSRVEVGVTKAGDGTQTTVIHGEVTALEQQTDSTGTWTVVRGYDPTHRLCRGRRTRTFLDTTDGDIVRQVAGAAGLDVGRVDDDGPTYEHVSQANLTDWEFLRSRAHETGHELAANGGRLEWRSLATSSAAPSAPADLFSPAQPCQLLLGRELCPVQAAGDGRRAGQRGTGARLGSRAEAGSRRHRAAPIRPAHAWRSRRPNWPRRSRPRRTWWSTVPSPASPTRTR